ncbi:MAG: hypothetical protein WD602_06925 [Actinomycetota bacterium]
MSDSDGAVPGPPRKRWPLGLAGGLGLLLLVSLFAAVISLRTIEGSIPGREPVLGLAAAGEYFLVGTAAGVYVSTDGVQWSALEQFSQGALVAQAGSDVLVLSQGELYRGAGPASLELVADGLPGALALAGDAAGRAWLGREEDLLIVEPEGERRPVRHREGPDDMVALAVDDTNTDKVFAGSLSSGLWYSRNGGRRFEPVLETPTRAVVVSVSGPRRFIGTAGGVLYSTPTDPWEFTDLRLSIEALARADRQYYAITTDRLLYRSADGLAWEPVAATD